MGSPAASVATPSTSVCSSIPSCSMSAELTDAVGVEMQDEDRAFLRDFVEFGGGQRFVFIEVDRFDAPREQRFVGSELVVDLVQSIEHVGDAPTARPVRPVRAVAAVVAEVGVRPERAGHRVGVGLDEARQQHVVREALVDRRVSPALEFRDGADAEHATVADGDGARFRSARVHRDDSIGDVDRGFFGHSVSVSRSDLSVRLRRSARCESRRRSS